MIIIRNETAETVEIGSLSGATYTLEPSKTMEVPVDMFKILIMPTARIRINAGVVKIKG